MIAEIRKKEILNYCEKNSVQDSQNLKVNNNNYFFDAQSTTPIDQEVLSVINEILSLLDKFIKIHIENQIKAGATINQIFDSK